MKKGTKNLEALDVDLGTRERGYRILFFLLSEVELLMGIYNLFCWWY